MDSVTLDFHFGSAETVRYRTDITFGWLDLMGENRETIQYQSKGVSSSFN